MWSLFFCQRKMEQMPGAQKLKELTETYDLNKSTRARKQHSCHWESGAKNIT